MTTTIKSLIDGIPSMGSHGGVIAELESVLNDPQSTLASVGEVIEKDPDLTARLLRLANSSFFGFPSRLDTIPEAISLIGIQQVQDLIVASNVIAIFHGISADSVNMQSFWKHSLACGVAARVLAIDRRMVKPEKFFVAGLLHDVGRLLLFSRAPQTAGDIFKLYRNQTMLLREAETRILGFDHASIGSELLKVWNYPPNLLNAVAYHHQPLSAGPFQLEACLVHVADYLVNAMELGNSGERFVPNLQSKACERLGLEKESIATVMEAVDDQIEAAVQTFLVPEKSDCDHDR